MGLPTEVFAYLVFEGQDGRVCPFAPFTWHNLAFDPFTLSPSAQPSTGLARWVTFTLFLTSWLSPPIDWW